MLQLIGTLLPVYGVVATLVAFVVLRGRLRWYAALLIPAVALGLCFRLGGAIARDGNLLFVALFALYLPFTLYLYYPAVVLWGGVVMVRRLMQREA